VNDQIGRGIDVENVSKSFGPLHALEDVSFRLAPGLTGLLGPNGAGKTTLLRILATVTPPDSGRVRTLGLDPCRDRDRRTIRESLGYMPQELGLYEGLRARDFLDYVATLKGLGSRAQRRTHVDQAIRRAQLSGEEAHKRIRSLSGGQRRRVGIAQALLGSPAVLLLDEPTVGLDPEQRVMFRTMISQLDSSPVVLLSTHLTEDVEALCARVIVIDEGHILFDGTPSALAHQAEGRIWKSTIPDGAALASWTMSDGTFKNIGDAPAAAQRLRPTLEDGYLVLLKAQQRPV